MKAQRLRVTFARTDEMKYVTHLDMMRFWERALRRAGLPVAYSEGFSPHPQIAMAAPLAVGTTGDAELMDVFMSEAIPSRRVIDALAGQIPEGVIVRTVEEVGLTLPALQADVRFAEYVIDVPVSTETSVADAIAAFLAAATMPWEHKREDDVRTYDIRTQVESIEIVDERDGLVSLRMLVKNDNSGSGRPEQIVAALGLPAPSRIHRTRLVLAGTSPTRDARRKHGRYAS